MLLVTKKTNVCDLNNFPLLDDRSNNAYYKSIFQHHREEEVEGEAGESGEELVLKKEQEEVDFSVGFVAPGSSSSVLLKAKKSSLFTIENLIKSDNPHKPN